MSEVRTINWYGCIKEKINDYIKTNNKRSITGKRLNELLNDMVAAISGGMLFGGEVTPTDTKDATGDTPVFYFASEAGTYTNLGNITVAEGELAFIYHDTNAAWHKMSWNLTTLFDGKVDTVEGKGLSKNDYTDEDKNKVGALPLPIKTSDTGKVLGVTENGLEWVEKPKDGEKGDKGDDAINPFKGWFKSGDTLPSKGNKGDYFYLKENGMSTIYRWNGTIFENTYEEVDAASVQSFNTGQAVNAVKIDDSELSDIETNDNTNQPVLVKASDAMLLKAKMQGINGSEIKIVNYETTLGKRIGNGGVIAAAGVGGVTQLPIPAGANYIRFRGVNLMPINEAVVGYAFGIVHNEGTQDESWENILFVPYDKNSEHVVRKEYFHEIPAGATHVRITCYWNDRTAGNQTLTDNFYLYFTIGSNIATLKDVTVLQNPSDESFAKAVDVMPIKSQIGKPSFKEAKVDVIMNGEGQNVFVGRIKNDGTIDVATNYYKYYFQIEIPEGVKRIRFAKPTGNWTGAGWALGNIINDNFVPKTYAAFQNNTDTEIIVEVDDETVFACTCGFYSVTNSKYFVSPWNFYCFLQEGNTINDSLKDKMGASELDDYWTWGKNLFSDTGRIVGYVTGSTFYNNRPTSRMSNLLKLEEGRVYTVSNVSMSESQRIGFIRCNENGELCTSEELQDGATPAASWIGGEQLGDPVATPVGIHKYIGRISFVYHNRGEAYIRININAGVDDSRIALAQLEIGEEQTEYAEYNSVRAFNFAKQSEVESANTINILAIGNSNSQDTLAYVPFLLKNIAKDVRVNIGIAYLGSSGIPNHIHNFDAYEQDPNAQGYHYEKATGAPTSSSTVKMYNNGKSYTYQYYYFENKNWLSYSSLYSIQSILHLLSWDIILFNVSSENNTLIELISKISEYIQANGLKKPIFGMINPAVSVVKENGKYWTGAGDEKHGRPYPEGTIESEGSDTLWGRWKNNLTGGQAVYNESLCEIIIPVCAAIINANTVEDFKMMGDLKWHRNNQNYINVVDDADGCYGYLRAPDGVHIQEGLPCQIAAYVACCKILEILGKSKESIITDTTICDDSWLDGKTIPGPNPGENSGPSYTGKNYTKIDVLSGEASGWSGVEATDKERVSFAQKCAIMAVKHPFEITDMNDNYGIKHMIIFDGNDSSRTNVKYLVNDGVGYSTELMPNTGYEITGVTVTMGGVDVTSQVYSSSTNTVNIDEVKGEVVIRVSTNLNQ